jgi:anti-sigma B factor antagonist
MSENDAATAVERIEGEMTIYRAAELKPLLVAALERQPTLDLDLSGVTELDTAGVQLLLMLHAHAKASRRTLKLSAPSPAVLDVFEILNLNTYFGDRLSTATA